MCFDLLCNFWRKSFSFLKELIEIWSKMHIGLQMKYPLFLLDFNENPCSDSRFVVCGQTDMKLIVVFRNFPNASKKNKVTC